MSRLIGLIGQARVGKDTVGNQLAGSYNFATYAFADPIKEMLETVFGNRFRDGDRESPIEWLGKSPRHLMQTLGTEWGRQQIHLELWVLLAEQRVKLAKLAQARNQNLVITDVRFPNEADMILRNGGELWHITRNDTAGVDSHISEHADWSGYDTVSVSNNGTLEELYAQVDALLML